MVANVRFYFSWRPPIAYGASPHAWWNTSSLGVTGSLSRTPEGVRNRNDMVQIKSAATNPYNQAAGVFVSGPLSAGTFGVGNKFRMATSAYITGTTPDAMLSVTIRLLDSSLNVKSTLYTGPSSTTTVTTGYVKNRKLTVSGTGTVRVLEDTLTAGGGVAAGDRIEVTVGVRWVTASTAANFFWRPTANERAVGDLPYVNDYVIPSDYALNTSLRDWIEFDTSTGITDVVLADSEVQFGDNFTLYSVSPTILNRGSTLPFVDLTKIDGIDGAPVQLSSQERQGAHGGYVTSEFEGPRTITLEGTLYATSATLHTHLQALKNIFRPSVLAKPLYMGMDSATYCYWGKSQGLRYVIDRDRSFGVARFQVQIICADPRKYDARRIVEPLGNGSYSLVNFTGDRSTPVVISVRNTGTGTTTNPEISLYNQDGEMDLQMQGTLQPTEELVIDTNNRTVIVNGLTNRRNITPMLSGSQNSKWLDMNPNPDTNFILLTQGSGSAITGEARFAPAWW